jgi:hypothetical protein
MKLEIGKLYHIPEDNVTGKLISYRKNDGLFGKGCWFVTLEIEDNMSVEYMIDTYGFSIEKV